jgi:flavin-dependent dehydrogenase
VANKQDKVNQQNKVDVCIIGGGPAGLAAAIAASQRGLSVTVADGSAPPIDKPCGEGLMPGTQAALRELGIELPLGVGYRFKGIQFAQRGARVAANFPQGTSIGIRRPVLHELLIQRAEQCGVSFRWKTPVTGINANGVQLGKEFVSTRWIVGADGCGSRVRRWAGLDAVADHCQRMATRRHYHVRPWSDYMEIHWANQAQAYVTPISEDQVCIVVLAENAEDAHFERILQELPDLREHLAGAELASKERGAMTAMHSLRRVACGNVVLVGDASGGVDAITGEGLRLAFQQSLTLGEAMEAGDLRRYEEAHRQLARRPTWMGKLILELGRHVQIRERALRVMSGKPELFARLLAIHVGQATTGDALMTGAQLGWSFLAA